jgi:AcrR family transcriptional regulator
MEKTTGPRRGRPKDPAHLEQRREQILDAAARVFAERGYATTEVQFVADASDIGKGTIYRYFPSKEELFLAAADRGMRRLRAAVDAACATADDPLDQLAVAIRAYLQFFKDHSEYAELLIQERAAFRDRKKPTYFENREAHLCRWCDLYRGLIDAGRIRDMPVPRIIDVVSDLVYGTMFTNHFSGRHKPLDDQAADILDVVFHGILTPAERRRRGNG